MKIKPSVIRWTIVVIIIAILLTSSLLLGSAVKRQQKTIDQNVNVIEDYKLKITKLETDLRLYGQIIEADHQEGDPNIGLAIMISNHDVSRDYIEGYAKGIGYEVYDYESVCVTLEQMGYLIHIPKFIYKDQVFEEIYTRPDTILADVYLANKE